MIKDELGAFTTANVMGSKQLQINVPKNYLKFFKVGSIIKIYSLDNDNDYLRRKVVSIGGGKQRVITLPTQDNLFKKGDKVRLYPI